MKKLLVVAIALFSLNGMAQKKGKRAMHHESISELRKDMTPNEIADLKTKKMILRLDLTDSQQKEVHKIILEQSEANQDLRKNRETKNLENSEKPSKDEFIKMQNHRLDQQIELKREMKTILTPEQYAKFEKEKPRKRKNKGKCSKK